MSANSFSFKLIFVFLFSSLIFLPLNFALAEGDGGDSGVTCSYPGDDGSDNKGDRAVCAGEGCTCDYEPYEPTECELRMWEIYAAADDAIQQLFTQPVCEDYIAGWGYGEPGIGAEAYDTLNGFVGQLSKNGKKSKKRVVSAKKLRKLKRQAKSCNR